MAEKEYNQSKDSPTTFTLRTKQVPDIPRVPKPDLNNSQKKSKE